VLTQGEKQFQVPLYQRTYSWQNDQLERLWDDIRERADALANDGSAATHFLGSVVLAPGVVQPSMQRWVLVDGQQRLTTLMLAMCAIRDHVSQSDRDQRDRINELYLVNKWQHGDDYLRLKPTKADLASYLACIQSTADAGGPDGIGNAYRFFRQRLASADDPDDPFDIQRIERAISDLLALVEITADRNDNVHRIFESLNNTGLKLSEADLVRNLIFMLLPTRGEKVYETVWLPMQDRLTAEQLEDLFYLYLIVSGQDRTRRDAIYLGMEKQLEPLRGNEDAVEAIVRELDRRARHFARIVTAEQEPDLRLRAVLRRLNTWEAQIAYPALMFLLDKQERGEVSIDELVEATGYIESFLIRRMISAVPTNNLNRIFNALINQLPADKPVAHAIRDVLSRERSYWPTDQMLRDAIATKPFYFQGRPLQRQVVLRRLEQSYGSREPVDLDKAALTIEHVLPQTPTTQWLSMLAEEADPGETPEELHKRLVHTLGNLTLTAYNTELSNNPYERKQDLLKASNLEMNKRIAATPRWGKREILARAADLATQAIGIWPSPLAGQAFDIGRDWSHLHQVLASLPAGAWTTYGDVAAVIGSHPVPVGTHLASVRVPNAHRVLRNDGTVSPNFRWLDPADDRDVRDVLREEGVRLAADGTADPNQRLSADDLAQLVGLATEGSPRGADWAGDPLAIEQGYLRFMTQVETFQGRAVSEATQQLLDDWRSFGGFLAFGKSAETTCSLMLRREKEVPWPCNFYPSGNVEVAFKPMSTRQPFDQVSLREEFRQRLNNAQGIDIPTVKLSLYPTFPLKVLTDRNAYPLVRDALRWFAAQIAE
jgi:alkylated DNA nucleotide flippase Atl1